MSAVLQPARSRATSRDVARLAGVAQSTVSYYMNGSRPVSAAARERIKKAMAALDYQPNSSARTLRTQRTHLIGLIERLYYESDNADTIPYLVTIIEEAYRLDYDVIVNTTKADPNALRRMNGRNICDGFILMDVPGDDSRIPVAAQIGVPTVVVGNPDDDHGLDTVYFDYAHAGGRIVDYVASLSHGRVVYLNDDAEAERYRSLSGMFANLRTGCAERGMAFDLVDFPEADPSQGMRHVRAHLDDRLAVVVRQPAATRRFFDECKAAGITPGRDMTLVSICPDSRARKFALQPSNISQQPRIVSQTAVRALIDRINDPECPQMRRPVRSDVVTTRQTTVDFTDSAM